MNETMSDQGRNGKVVSLDAVRQRRVFIALAQADEAWQHTKASFALSGIALTDDDAERAARLLADVVTYDEMVAEMRSEAGV